MDLTVGTKVYFVERYTPSGVDPKAVGVVVSVEKPATPWQPRVRVRVGNYLSGWIWSNFVARA
jgi:hypothetical protein